MYYSREDVWLKEDAWLLRGGLLAIIVMWGVAFLFK
jgi:hypothetical protein